MTTCREPVKCLLKLTNLQKSTQTDISHVQSCCCDCVTCTPTWLQGCSTQAACTKPRNIVTRYSKACPNLRLCTRYQVTCPRHEIRTITRNLKQDCKTSTYPKGILQECFVAKASDTRSQCPGACQNRNPSPALRYPLSASALSPASRCNKNGYALHISNTAAAQQITVNAFQDVLRLLQSPLNPVIIHRFHMVRTTALIVGIVGLTVPCNNGRKH